MELQLKFEILSKILDNRDEIIKIKNKLSSFINVEKDILNKDNQIFFEFHIHEDVEEEILKSIIEQYEIAMQILINQGYKIYVYNSQEKYSDICREFVEIFKDESIRYIENKENNLKLIQESKHTIIMSEEYFLLSLLLEKPCISMFIDEKLLSLIEINNILIKKEDFNAGVLLDKVKYAEENYTRIKEDMANLFEKSRKEMLETCDELVDIKNQNYGNEKQIIHDENPDDMELYKNQLKQKIQSMIEQGQLEEAKQILAEYEKIVKEDIDLFSIRGVIAMMEGDMDGAERVFKEGLKIEAYNFDLMYNLAFMYEGTSLACKPLALYYYNRCLEVTNDNNLRIQLEEKIQDIKRELYIFNKDEDKRPLVSIVVLAYNKLEYTKMCIESLFEYTSHIDYELITVNNGSSDGTEEFFNSLPNRKKINIKNNVGGVSGFNAGLFYAEGKYLVYVGNDLILTKKWLDNLLNCIKSDDNIGFVAPGSNILSNYQAIPINYTNIEEMHSFAEKYNISDSNKWEERLRVMPLTMVIKKELFDRTGGFDHRYYFGEFSDDDFSFTIRRLGYKLIYAADTFIHHFGSITGSEAKRNNNSLGIGYKIFTDKFNIDPWKEASFDNNIIECIALLKNIKDLKILGINCFCGGTTLQIKNILLREDIEGVEVINYTSNNKYEIDLKTVSNKVIIDELDNIDHYKDIKNINYIVIESDFSEIQDIDIFLMKIQRLLSSQYQIIIKLDNPNYYINMYNSFNNITTLRQINLNVYKLQAKLLDIFFGETKIINICEEMNEQNSFLNSIKINGSALSKEQISQLLTKFFIISITKK